jgi:SAM-dependent methyltransferase
MSDGGAERPANADTGAWSARRTAFGNAADAYATGRPSYPREAVEWTLDAEARTVLDLAAGTGRLTTRLLELGLDVIAVEPLAEMRAHIPAPAVLLDGAAEDLPLDDGSVDAVLVGQAFHWFDVPRATAEMRRVLRPGGTIGLFWNMLDDSDPWVDELCDLVEAEERFSRLDPDQAPPYDVDGLTTPERRLFPHTERYDVERLLAFVTSRSQTILADEAARTRMTEGLRRLAPAGVFDLPLVCEAWRGVRP